MAHHTIKGKNWFNYPCLQKGEFETIVLSHGKTTFQIYVGQQEGHWVSGYNVSGAGGSSSGGGCYPSRKWGDYETKEQAVGQTVAECVDHYFKNDAAMIKHIEQSRYNHFGLPFITGLWGCKCHPFSSWKMCETFHRRRFKNLDPVLNRCSGKKGIITNTNNVRNEYNVKYEDGSTDGMLHAAMLFPL